MGIVRRGLYALFLLLYLAIMLTVFVLWHRGNRVLSVLVAVLLCAAAVALAAWLKPAIDAADSKKFRRVMAILCGAFAVLMAAVSQLILYYPIMDLKVIYSAVPDLLDNGVLNQYNGYFVVCQNNIGLLLFLGLLFKALSVFGIAAGTAAGWAAAAVFNALMVALAVFFLCRCARELFASQFAEAATWAICATSGIFYLWSPYFYTDTLSMPFITGALLLFLRSRKPADVKKRLPMAAALGAVLFLGFALRGSVAVMLPAVVMVVLIEHRGGIREAVACALVVAAAFGLCNFGYGLWKQYGKTIDFSAEEKVGLPLELWFLYGSHGTGGYNADDLGLIEGVEGLANRKAILREAIAENYLRYTPGEYFDFITKKWAFTWADGKMDADAFNLNQYRATFAHYVILEGMPFYGPLHYYCQVHYYAILLLYLCSLVGRALGKGFHPVLLVHLIVFGTMLFLCFWETAPRYGLSVVPLLVAGAADGLNLAAARVRPLLAKWGPKKPEQRP